jgi:S-adenosylmethionine hydrolase
MAMSSVITLTTDFGLSDGYVASVKGVILSINPEATIVDISHSVEPQNILQAAFILHTAHHYFPDGAIHIIVVDPSVGSQRKAIILRTPSAYFLAPDNGVLSYIINEICPEPATQPTKASPSPELRSIKGYLEAVAITNPAYWRQPVSTTFQGRDIFASVAAHLSLGVLQKQFGEAVDCLYTFPMPQPYCDSDGSLIGRILHIDNFGNLITNIRDSDLLREVVNIEVGRQFIPGINRFYAEKEGLAAIWGSCGYLEISLSNGNAAVFLAVKVGDKVRLVSKNRRKTV